MQLRAPSAFARALAFVVSSFALAASPAYAASVFYEVDHSFGITWEYFYTVSNDSLATPIAEFTIEFDRALYTNLDIREINLEETPAGWDPIDLQPDPALPSNGYYDALSFGEGVALGSTVGFFGLHFDYLGSGVPGPQPFTLYDANFEVLATGMTTPLISAIPEPTSALLLLLGLPVLVVIRRLSR